VTEQGQLRASVVFTYALSPASTLTQTVRLTAISPRLYFDTEVEWHERHKFLKVEFPLAVRAANATYEIQFGYLQRPTHFNTSWDMARFEVVAHKWADLSDPLFGVALLNDCKYGHATHGNVMRLSLLRSPTSPDPEADQGHHTFRYALLPHAGQPQAAGVIAEGYRFNMPLQVFPTASNPAQQSFFSLSNSQVVLDTVKKAEDSDDIVVRLYESQGTHGSVRLFSPLPFESACRCNLLEDDDREKPLPWTENGIEFTVRPFEIVTFKLKPARR
jgi:alpha-mannosidase